MEERRNIDRRDNPRILVRALVDYESQETYLYDYSENMSRGGLFISTDKPLDVGTLIDLKFSLPDVEKVFEVKGEVRWNNVDKNHNTLIGMGIEFKDLTDADRELIEEYLESISK